MKMPTLFLKAFRSLRDQRVLLFLIVLLGSLLRIWAVSSLIISPHSDFLVYFQRAQSFYAGDSHYYPLKPMGYPIILGLWFKLIGSASVMGAKTLNLIFSILTLVSAWVLSYQLNLNDFQKVKLVGLVSFFPMLIFYTTIVGVETIMIFFLFLVLNFLIWDKRIISWVVIGLIAGVLAHLKSFFVLIPAGILVIYWLIKKDWKEIFSALGVILIGFSIMVGPSTLKNYDLLGKVLLVPTNQAMVLYLGNNDQNQDGTFLKLGSVKPSETLIGDLDKKGYSYPLVSTEVESISDLSNYYDSLQAEAFRWIRNNPSKFLQLAFLRIGNVFFGSDSLHFPLFEYTALMEMRLANLAGLISDISIYFLSSILIVFLICNSGRLLISLFSREKSLDLLTAIVFVFCVISIAAYAIGEGQPRYFLTLLPFASLVFSKVQFGMADLQTEASVLSQNNANKSWGNISKVIVSIGLAFGIVLTVIGISRDFEVVDGSLSHISTNLDHLVFRGSDKEIRAVELEWELFSLTDNFITIRSKERLFVNKFSGYRVCDVHGECFDDIEANSFNAPYQSDAYANGLLYLTIERHSSSENKDDQLDAGIAYLETNEIMIYREP